MARRKAAATTKKRPTRGKSRPRNVSRKRVARKVARKSAARKKSAAVARTRKARKAQPRRTSKGRAAARKANTAVKRTRRRASVSAATKKPAARRTAPAKRTVTLRKPPDLDRERRTIQDDDIVPTPPSSLDLDRSASAARTGRRELRERLDEHTETSPALTAGDVDADWESAYSVGDEAPGGDNPTPDQDIVDDIGRAVGVQYEDNEELKGEAKISKRDKHRWELDPASAEDFNKR
jgi:Family of unknown function (DUF6335)